jgi:excisionase family DNA binding protein
MKTVLELPGYTVPEVERILGIGRKGGYKLIKAGKLNAHHDGNGQLRIAYGELYAYVKSREEEKIRSLTRLEVEGRWPKLA